MARTKTRFKEIDYGYKEFSKVWTEKKSSSSVNIGIITAKQHEGSAGFSVADIAAAHEFGTKHIPERPFMRLTLIRNQKDINKLVGKLLLKLFTFRIKKNTALGILGQFIKDKMVETIDSSIPPPLDGKYAKRKGSTKTLVDTGQMRSSIDWELE